MSFNEDDEFADFQNCTFEDPETNKKCVVLSYQNDEDQDDFADFADFQNADLPVNHSEQCCLNEITSNYPSACSSSIPNGNSKFESILKDAFPNSESQISQTVIITELFTDDYKISLWNQIQNLEDSPSLKLKWNKTQSFQNFLTALRINPKIKLNNPHVPIFASSLGLLEPIKLKTDTRNESIQNLSSSSLDYSNVQATTNSVINNTHLKNSLNDIRATNSICNDFDSKTNGCSNDKSNQLINVSIKQNLTHDKVIKTDNQKKTDESDTNNKILDELPILNFMRSNTIMFND